MIFDLLSIHSGGLLQKGQHKSIRVQLFNFGLAGYRTEKEGTRISCTRPRSLLAAHLSYNPTQDKVRVSLHILFMKFTWGREEI